MSSNGDEEPFIPEDSRGGLSDTLGRILQRVAPDSYVAGGASDDSPGFDQRPRDYETLKEFEKIYTAGGPISDFIDTRSLMTYGTGIEFTTDEDGVTEVVDGDVMTVADWLHDTFPLIDQTMIERGIHAYVYGDAWPELVETRGGGVSHLNLIHPTTVDARWDDHGKISKLRQVVKDSNGKFRTQGLDSDEVGHWYFKQASSGPLGESLIRQNWQEIQWYRANQQQRANAIKLHGSPKYHVQVGTEAQTIGDRLMRRVRDRFRSSETDEKTNWVTGGDIEIGELDAPGFDGMDSITETDIMKLASGFGVPLEWTNFGSAGMGEGAPAESRIKKFERQARAEQRRAAVQLKEFPLRWVVDELSPFPPGTHFDVEFGDVVSDRQKVADTYSQYRWAYHRDELREKLGDKPWQGDEDEDAPLERAPPASGGGAGADPVGPAAGGGGDDGGGLFTEPDEGDAPDPLDESAKRIHTDGGVRQRLQSASTTDEYRTLAEDFGAETFQLVDDDPDSDMQSDLLGVGVDFPNSGVYVDWNIAAWPDDQQLDGPHVSDYASMEDLEQVSEGRVEPLGTVEAGKNLTSGGSGNADGRALFHGEASADSLTQEELVWSEVYEHVLWAEDGDRALFQFDPEEVPEFVIERLREAVTSGALFDDFETVSASAADSIGDALVNSLDERDGWSIDSLTEQVQEAAPELDHEEAERIARTETQSLVNNAREEGYEEQFDTDQERFDWVGPSDHRTTQTCASIKERVPDGGLPLDELRSLVEDVASEQGHDPREWTPHINCRHTFTRVVE